MYPRPSAGDGSVGPSSFAYWRLDTVQLCTFGYSLRRSAPTHQCLQIDEANIIFDWITWSVCAAICINHIGQRIAQGWCHDDKLSRWRTLSMGSWCGWYCARPHCSKSSLALRVLVSGKPTDNGQEGGACACRSSSDDHHLLPPIILRSGSSQSYLESSKMTGEPIIYHYGLISVLSCKASDNWGLLVRLVVVQPAPAPSWSGNCRTTLDVVLCCGSLGLIFNYDGKLGIDCCWSMGDASQLPVCGNNLFDRLHVMSTNSYWPWREWVVGGPASCGIWGGLALGR